MKNSASKFFLMILLTSTSIVALAQQCVGDIKPPPEGMREVSDDYLLASVIGKPGNGMLCKGKVYVAEKPVTVYRVWDKDKSYTLYGRWWDFEKPTGTSEEYARNTGLCPEWSKMNAMSACTIKVGTKIVVGPSQSARCMDGTLPASAKNQVYIPNDSRNAILYVEHCTPDENWPK